MSGRNSIAATLVAVSLFGCGTYVPDLQDFGGRVEGMQFVQAILTNVTCELRDAVNDLRAAYPQGTFIENWGVQTTLSLAVDEKGAIAPNVVWMPVSPPSSVFTLGAGLTVSAEANRTNKINGYYLVSELKKRCSAGARPNGPFLLQSDLKLSEWLFNAVAASMRNNIDFELAGAVAKENALQHEVKFEVITSGTLTPTWKLTEATVNGSGDFLSGGRTRTHDLLITFGPVDDAVAAIIKKRGAKGNRVVAHPAPQASELHLSSLIATSIENAVRNGLRR